MANYDEIFRTNYFKVKDLDLFKERLDEIKESHSAIEVWTLLNGAGETLIGFGGYCSFPDSIQDEVTGEFIEIDLMAEIADHLEKGWVAVMHFCGNENLRYLSGGAVAVNSEGEQKYFNLYQFMNEAQSLGEYCTAPEY